MDWASLSNEYGALFLFIAACALFVGSLWLISKLIEYTIAGAGLLGLFCGEISGTAFVIYIACWIFAFPVMLVLSILAGLIVGRLNRQAKQPAMC